MDGELRSALLSIAGDGGAQRGLAAALAFKILSKAGKTLED